jgi:hypothetical protein
MDFLAELRAQPDAKSQAEVAGRLLDPKQRRDTLMAYLKALEKEPTPSARRSLVQLYEHYAANGPKRDPGAYMRRAVVDALRPIAGAEEMPLLVRAVQTFERLPPGFREEAGLLRAGAIVALSEIDGVLAGFHAAWLLLDQHIEPMSGEPAVTAARVLANLSAWLPLYMVASHGGEEDAPVASPQSGTRGHTPSRRNDNTAPDIAPPEVVAECLRSLNSIPAELVPGLVRRHGQSPHVIVRVGLFDLLIGHRAGPLEIGYLEASLADLDDADAYRYLVMALLTSRNDQLVELVRSTARLEARRDRVAVLREAASLFPALLDLR